MAKPRDTTRLCGVRRVLDFNRMNRPLWSSFRITLPPDTMLDGYLCDTLPKLLDDWTANGALQLWNFERECDGPQEFQLRVLGSLVGPRACAQLQAQPGVCAIPEVAVHGGPPLESVAAQAANELLAECSSRIALETIRLTGRNAGQRLSIAWDCMAASLLATRVSATAMTSFLDHYTGHTPRAMPAALPGPGAAWWRNVRCTREMPAVSAMLSRWICGVEVLLAELDRLHAADALCTPVPGEHAYGLLVRDVLGWHMRMHNNRLGIGLALDRRLAQLLRQAVQGAERAPLPTFIRRH